MNAAIGKLSKSHWVLKDILKMFYEITFSLLKLQIFRETKQSVIFV